MHLFLPLAQLSTCEGHKKGSCPLRSQDWFAGGEGEGWGTPNPLPRTKRTWKEGESWRAPCSASRGDRVRWRRHLLY